MNLIKFEPKECRQLSAQLDDYLNNKLPEAAGAGLQTHLRQCAECSALLAERARLRQSLQHAAQSEEIPAALQHKIRRQLRTTAAPPRRSNFRLWAVAAAALLLLFGGWTIFRWSATRQQAADRQLTAAVFNIGLNDHVQCAIKHGKEREQWSAERMQASLGADFAGLLPLAQANLPAGYELTLAHKCHVAGREFVHLILRQPAHTLSLIITKKENEAYPQQLAEALQTQGVKLHRARGQDYELAGFETRQYLAYVISNAAQEENLQVAAQFAPPVRALLAQLETATG